MVIEEFERMWKEMSVA